MKIDKSFIFGFIFGFIGGPLIALLTFLSLYSILEGYDTDGLEFIISTLAYLIVFIYSFIIKNKTLRKGLFFGIIFLFIFFIFAMFTMGAFKWG